MQEWTKTECIKELSCVPLNFIVAIYTELAEFARENRLFHRSLGPQLYTAASPAKTKITE